MHTHTTPALQTVGNIAVSRVSWNEFVAICKKKCTWMKAGVKCDRKSRKNTDNVYIPFSLCVCMFIDNNLVDNQIILWVLP